MKKDVLNLNIIIENYNIFDKLFKHLSFVLLGSLFIFWRITCLSHNIKNVIFESVLILIGIYFLFKGFYNLVYTIREHYLIKNGDIQIYIDTIIDKRKVLKNDEYDVRQHQVRLSQYSCLSDKYFCIKSTEDFKKARIGSDCILIFTKLNKIPLASYLDDYHVLDDNLKQKLTNNLHCLIQ